MSSELKQNPATTTGSAQPEASARRPNVAPRYNWRYGLAVLGGLLLIVSAFLPWIGARFETIGQSFSVSGLGGLSGTGTLPDTKLLPALDSGIGAIIVGVMSLGLALLSLWLNRTEFAAGLTVFGLFALTTIFWSLSRMGPAMEQVRKVGVTLYMTTKEGELHVSPLMVAGVGFGVFVAILGALLVTLGGILPMAAKQRRKQSRKA